MILVNYIELISTFLNVIVIYSGFMTNIINEISVKFCGEKWT